MSNEKTFFNNITDYALRITHHGISDIIELDMINFKIAVIGSCRDTCIYSRKIEIENDNPYKSPSPCGRGRGGGVTFQVTNHPHPNPLPSRERELLVGFHFYFSVIYHNVEET
jgi:hypothetical protein